ncbi:MAG: DUF3604 domain-containing protein, partial [Chloroflexota bacterium]
DHSGRPGLAPATADELLVRGGLAAVYAERRSRGAIFDALRARRTYGTTGERIVLWVSLNGHPLGSECAISDPPRVFVRVDSPLPLERIDFLKGTEVCHRERFGAPGRRLRVSWTGAENDTRGRVTCWDGGLALTGGRIVSVEPWAFDRPSEGIQSRDERSIRWRSSTAGDLDGVILDLDAPDDAELVFETGPASFRVHPSAIGEDPLVVDAGQKERRVVVERIPDEPGPTSARVTWEDPAPGTGGAYWARVVLASGGRAWSSPIFATVEGA